MQAHEVKIQVEVAYLDKATSFENAYALVGHAGDLCIYDRSRPISADSLLAVFAPGIWTQVKRNEG